MPPRSSQRTKARREAEVQHQSDADTPEAIQTPSRKRRRTNRTEPEVKPGTNGVSRSRRSVDSVETMQGEEEETVTRSNEDTIADVTQGLLVAKHSINATVDYSNDLQYRDDPNPRQAYGKIAGREWSYLITDVSVRIGRVDRAGEGERDGHGDTSQATQQQVQDDRTATWNVNIDLGPEKHVSRIHAEISYNAELKNWYIHVNGRNGVVLDGRTIRRGETAQLRSGSVFEISGTQMLFILPTESVEIDPVIRKQIWPEENGETEDEDDNLRPPAQNPPKQSSPRATHPSSSAPHPSSQAYHAQAQYNHLPTSQATYKQAAPDTPTAQRMRELPVKNMSPAYSRGLMLQSTEDIDYSQDSAKDIKPPHSYAQMIGQAIMSTDERQLTLAKIYDFIKENYAYYRVTQSGWQNSIRHNLSLNKAFEKVARRTDEPGKGMKWRINPEHEEEFMKKGLLNPRKGMQRLRSSGPNSPAGKEPHAGQMAERFGGPLSPTKFNSAVPQYFDRTIKPSPDSTTPPLAGYPSAQEAYTPDRGPRGPRINSVYPTNGDKHATLKSMEEPNSTTSVNGIPDSSPDVKAKLGGLNANAASQQSPPTLSSSFYATSALRGDSHNPPFVTPMVARHVPKLAPPSTAQAPSYFANLSSPAPFYKFFDLHSTPARGMGLDISPSKYFDEKLAKKEEAEITEKVDEDSDEKMGEDAEDGDDNEDKDVAGPPQPSSPPVLIANGEGRTTPDAAENDEEGEGDASPSRTVSRPGSRRELASTISHIPPPTSAPAQQLQPRSHSVTANGSSMHAANGAVPLGLEDDEDDAPIDLARGFQKIGSFHQNQYRTAVAGGGGLFRATQ